MRYRTAPAGVVEPLPGTFERDSLIWTLGKLAERVVEQLFRSPSTRARYARWLLEEVPVLDVEGSEGGLLMLSLELRGDGSVRVIARPARGEFVLMLEHADFHAVVATAYGLLSERQQQDGVCLAHFEGDAGLASRWALGLHAWLERRWRAEASEPDLPAVAN